MLHWILVYVGVGPRKLYRQPHLLSAHALVLKMRAIAAGRITPYVQLEIDNWVFLRSGMVNCKRA